MFRKANRKSQQLFRLSKTAENLPNVARGIGQSPGYFGNRIPLQPALGGVCGLENYNVAYEETHSNRVSIFHDFVCFLFPNAFLFLILFVDFLLERQHL